MTNYNMTATFTERGKAYEKYTGFKLGNDWVRCLNGHADKVPVNQPCDIEYREWTNPQGKTMYFLNKINGQNVSKPPVAPATASSGAGGPLGAPKPAEGTLGAKGGGGDQNSWAGMGPENRARMAVKGIMEARYGITGVDLPGEQALALEMVMVYQAWLTAIEGKGMPPKGNSQATGGGNDLDDEIPFDDGDPGPQGESDYMQ